MKTVTKMATMALVLGTSTLFASSDDYALTDSYKLLNDMNLAKKQQELVVNMSQALESDIIDMEALKQSQNRFGTVLAGLSSGDDSMKLKGTTMPNLRAKLSEVQTLWKKELVSLGSVESNDNSRDKAIDGLNNIMIKMSQAVSLYNKSYSRFKQKSKISSIVNRHISGRQNQMLAFSKVR